MAIRQSLTAMDAVVRLHGRELGLTETEVMIVMLLEALRSRTASELAISCGRPRQQVQRSIEALSRRDLVQAVKSPSGRSEWALTEYGSELSQRMAVRLSTFEELAGGASVLEPVALALEGITNSLVNQRSGYGWRVQRPMASRLDPNWDREADDPEWWIVLYPPILPGTMELHEEGLDGQGNSG
jgi:DNA-binding MarR family transcriptional regulator